VTKVISISTTGVHDGFAEELMPHDSAYKWLPVVIEEACTGCALCVAACGPACLETQNLLAVLERPSDCGSEEHCISACPEEAIHMAWLPSEGNPLIGLWRTAEEMKSESMPIPVIIYT
jgi:Na+-translocating ferredoxin:NAD+ oxidoreductase RNF subunit RnfB